MSRVLVILWFALMASIECTAVPHSASITIPGFPLPKFAIDRYGQPKKLSMLGMLRILHRGEVRGSNGFEASDNEYLVISSESLGLFSAWIEAACKAGGIELPHARQRPYNGAVYANLLRTVTNIATAHHTDEALAIPVGVMICTRHKPWGVLPGDGERDAYVLIATERGFVVFDPPTRQSVLLTDYPNNSEVVNISI